MPSSPTPKEVKDDLVARLKACTAANGCQGNMHIVEIPSEDSDGNETTEDTVTVAQLGTLRYILINDARKKAVGAGFEFASGRDDGDRFKSFNTQDGNELIFAIPTQVKKALGKKTRPARFDALLGLTFALKMQDHWMVDNECWMEGGELKKAITCLAKAWKTTLSSTDAELGGARTPLLVPGLGY